MRPRRHLPQGMAGSRTLRAWRRSLRRRRWFLYAGTFVGAAVLGYAVAALLLFPAPILASRTSVPRVIGSDLQAAREAIARAGLKPEKAEEVRHPTLAPGTVVWQDPPPGVVVPQGTSVQLSVSTGPQRVPVPDVTGYDQSLGTELLEAAGLRVGAIESAQTAVPKGVIVNTRPPAGAALVPGGRVTVVVSVGAPTIVVPDLQGLTLEEARAALEQAGLSLGTYFRRTSSARAGTIIEQRPAAGTLTAPGVAVDVILARRGGS